jgi:hypothetical protein
MNSAYTPGQALDAMLKALRKYLPPHDGSDPPPAPTVSVISVTERALAVGNRRGTERRGLFPVVALKGCRLDAVVRFQLWANERDDVDAAIEELQRRLLADRDGLWADGFLRIGAEGTSPAEHVSPPDSWRKSTDYKVLYEFHYEDTDGAEGIIARIPIHSDLEVRDSLPRETTIVTDEMVRWGDGEAPVLEVTGTARSGVRVTGLAVLAHLPAGWTGNQVTLVRLDRRSVQLPTEYPTLEEFHAAVTHPVHPDRHARVTFGSVVDFLAEFEPAGGPIQLSVTDGAPDEYQPATVAFDPPIRLETGDDLIQISVQDAAFAPAVVYLRAQVHGA